MFPKENQFLQLGSQYFLGSAPAHGSSGALEILWRNARLFQFSKGGQHGAMQALSLQHGAEVSDPVGKFPDGPRHRQPHLEASSRQRPLVVECELDPGEPVGEVAEREEVDVRVRTAGVGERAAQVQAQQVVGHKHGARTQPRRGT